MQEKEWILKAQKGDGDAFCALIGQYENKIYNIAYKFMQNSFDAQDAAQDAIIKMYGSIRKFSFQSAFSTWMYRVVANTCLDLLRRRKPSVPVEEYSDAVVSREGNPAEQTENNELGRSIRAAVQELSEKYRMVLILKDMEGLKYEEVAEILSITPGTVKSRLFRAREKLRKILEEKQIV
ncbi:MAG: sigma-70 family RNA polymerase sigma factor [Christensenella sp.]|uniref:RNA polymerase sigma factor n=1 Tax=Christensenella sp. TaxID=1935934 RepID=UPI002B214CED|nr:sigma-70 family RNA polymerase sigma factor [Christensenella sp.]MEA5003646.1 sigma-70 family RNA polymerase sigma factor [Christensenella sp.]